MATPRGMGEDGMPPAEALRRLRTLAPFLAADSRATAPDRAEAPPSLCAFVCRVRERIGALRLDRAALMIVAEGQKEVIQGGLQSRLQAGQALCLPPGWRGDVVNDPDPRSGAYRTLCLTFPPALVARAGQAHPPAQRRPARRGLPGPFAPSAPLMEAVLHLAEGFAAARPAHLVEHRAMEVLLALLDQGVLPAAEGGTAGEAVRALLRWRPEHRWTAEEIGRELGMSQATLRRRLAAEGTALRALLREERMAHAQALMAEGGVTVREAATASGYASASRFARRFRDVHGVPPSRRRMAG